MLGLVSSVFTTLMPGESLPSLIDQSVAQGVRWIELRQGTLGAPYEDGQQIPSPEHIAALVKSFGPAGVCFGYAFVLPVFSSPLANATTQSAIFQAAIDTAEAVRAATGGSSQFQLRCVDLTANNANFNRSLVPMISVTLDALYAVATIQHGFLLSVENAQLSWGTFSPLLSASPLSFCFDPCNIVAYSNPGDPTLPSEAALSLKASRIALLHAKQSVAGAIAPAITNGALDWAQQAAALNQTGFSGPVLLEVASSPSLFSDIPASVSFLTQQGFSFAPPLSSSPPPGVC